MKNLILSNTFVFLRLEFSIVWPTLNHTRHFLSKLGTLGIQICDQIIQLQVYIKKVENLIT